MHACRQYVRNRALTKHSEQTTSQQFKETNRCALWCISICLICLGALWTGIIVGGRQLNEAIQAVKAIEAIKAIQAPEVIPGRDATLAPSLHNSARCEVLIGPYEFC